MADYGTLSKLLHNLSLGNTVVGEICFDIELSAKRKDIHPSINGRHVFVSGLARAGTTILMRSLYDTGEFASLTYRDMPFVLAPNLWAKIVRYVNLETNKKVRAHGDGILIDFDSPEALEEVYWKTFIGKKYIRKDRLLPHTVEHEIVEKFRDYVSLLLMRYDKSRYLSKNNNNVLRLNSILDTFPHAIVLVPFREPFQQAYSLMKQHQRFKNESDPFTKKYMGWLAHHEFGSAHRPFEWGVQNKEKYHTDTINYWLYQWVATYSALLDMFEKQPSQCTRLIFICYESICFDSGGVWAALSNKLNIDSRTIPDFEMKFDKTPSSNNLKLEQRAKELYEKLSSYSRSGLGLS